MIGLPNVSIVGIDPGDTTGIANYETGKFNFGEIGRTYSESAMAAKLGQLFILSDSPNLYSGTVSVCIVEFPEHRGPMSSVGKSTFRAAHIGGFLGRFAHFEGIKRMEKNVFLFLQPHIVRRLLTGGVSAKASQVRQGILDVVDPKREHGKMGKGKTALPGPLYGISGNHEWDALALVVAFIKLFNSTNYVGFDLFEQNSAKKSEAVVAEWTPPFVSVEENIEGMREIYRRLL